MEVTLKEEVWRVAYTDETLSPEDEATAQSIYDANSLEGYILISCNITLPQGWGIINCRSSVEDHKQIRF